MTKMKNRAPSLILLHPDPAMRHGLTVLWELLEELKKAIRVTVKHANPGGFELRVIARRWQKTGRLLASVIAGIHSLPEPLANLPTDLDLLLKALDLIAEAEAVTPVGSSPIECVPPDLMQELLGPLRETYARFKDWATQHRANGKPEPNAIRTRQFCAGLFSILCEGQTLLLKEAMVTSESSGKTADVNPVNEEAVSPQIGPSRPLPLQVGRETQPRRRPAYYRDHLWLDWRLQGKMGPAAIRDRWDGMSDDERKAMCPRAWQSIGGDDAKTKRSGRAVVVNGLKKARKEKERDRGP
jgi:hypothetical protein